jgi:hypothetical protein
MSRRRNLMMSLGGASPYSGIITSYWKFNNNIDDSVGSNNGSVETDIVYSSGLIDNCANYNGSTSDIQIPNSSELNFTSGNDVDLPVSVMILMKMDVLGNVYFFDKRVGSSSGREYQFQVHNNQLRLWYWVGVGAGRLRVHANPVFVVGEWTTICFTYDASKLSSGLKLYQDGNELAKTVNEDYLYTGSVASTGNVTFGKYRYNTSNTLNGAVNAIAVFNVGLSASGVLDASNKLLIDNVHLI